MKKQTLLLLALCMPCLAAAQTLAGISSQYNDSFVEWQFFTTDDEEGELKIRWLSRGDDWTEWEYDLAEVFGTIKLKWKDKPDEWELRGNNQIVTARTLWNNDFGEWRITDGTHTFTLKTRWANQWDEWLVRDDTHGRFTMYTVYERDIRDWAVEDNLDGEVSFETKMMLMFVVVFNSTPRQ